MGLAKWTKSEGKDVVNGYVVFLDTGKGMSDRDCEAFATYGEKKARYDFRYAYSFNYTTMDADTFDKVS